METTEQTTDTLQADTTSGPQTTPGPQAPYCPFCGNKEYFNFVRVKSGCFLECAICRASGPTMPETELTAEVEEAFYARSFTDEYDADDLPICLAAGILAKKMMRVYELAEERSGEIRDDPEGNYQSDLCPFCGGKEIKGELFVHSAFIICPSCGSCGPCVEYKQFSDRAEAFDGWSSRTGPKEGVLGIFHSVYPPSNVPDQEGTNDA